MSDTNADTSETTKAPGALNVKAVKRRMEKIATVSSPKAAAKRRRKLAVAIISQIASGRIKAPRAVAQAFVEAGGLAAPTESGEAAGAGS